MKKISAILFAAILLTGCTSQTSAASSVTSEKMGCEWGETSCSDATSSPESNTDAAGETVGAKADMSGYDSYNAVTDYVFVVSDVNHMLERMKNGDTFVTYFGFSSCPWCRDAMPILNETASSYHYQVDYIDTRADSSWTSNLDLKDYDKLVEAVGDLFPVDEDGKAHLDVPFVIFFKDGKVVSSAGYPQYDAHERKINEEEAQEEKESYIKGFEALK